MLDTKTLTEAFDDTLRGWRASGRPEDAHEFCMALLGRLTVGAVPATAAAPGPQGGTVIVPFPKPTAD